MLNPINKTIELGDGRTITIETGKLAKQADGAVTVRLLRKTGSTDALCWYRRLALPILPNFKSNLKN